MSFIPEGHSIPETPSRYTKVKEGQTVRLRIISPTITDGWLRWTVEPKPVRWRRNEEQPVRGDWKDENPKYIWILTVWNYASEQVEVFEISQKSIMEAIEQYAKDEDYGHPNRYDLKIGRTGSGLETKYTVVASPPKDIAPEVGEQFKDLPNLDALFSGEDPFKS